MKNVRLWALLALLALAPGMTSCRLFRKSRKVSPPAPVPVPTQTQPAPAPRQPPAQPPAAPPAEPHPEETPKTEEPASIKLPMPPRSKRRPSPSGSRVQPPAPPATPVPATAPTAPPEPAPQLRPMLTPEQHKQLERTTAAHIERARQALAALRGRQLTQDQQEVVNQVRTFLRQAEETRPTDLVRAGNLAERADVLAQDLLRSLQ